MNNIKINIYKKVLQGVCEKFNDVKAFVGERTDELCNEKKLAAEELTYLFMNIYNNFKAVC